MGASCMASASVSTVYAELVPTGVICTSWVAKLYEQFFPSPKPTN